MGALKLKPACKSYLWGGHRLVEEYNKDFDGPILAESWELSCHPDGLSVIDSGPWRGMTLADYIAREGWEVLGTGSAGRRDFPILIKLIDAKQDLSIQVHPDDAYALAHEGQRGKTELWYVLDCKPGAKLYYGFRREVSRAEVEERIRDHTLPQVLNAVSARPGSLFYVSPGTVHAIGADILLAEIQQSSTVTYRLYDYGRKGPDGRERELHIQKALDVASLCPPESRDFWPHLAACGYFTVDAFHLDAGLVAQVSGTVTGRSFLSLLFAEGEGTLACGGEVLPYRKGDSFFLPAGSGEYTISGRGLVLLTSCP